MAIISSNSRTQAEVKAVGNAKSATMNFSGALMEMLATVYSFILMSSIREALQNACDAARKNGLSFAEGVTVLLPTAANPMITIIDRGQGMSREFMETDYLSFGTSTKTADNDSVGGLGVGRWAAYGYIRECFISTCHASDMIERTYFQFQGEGGSPMGQLASEVPGTVVGTKVFFPVKESDLGEALRAVSWLREIMQLTMGDAFSVDMPGALPEVLPCASGTVLDLGIDDPSLSGVRVYPMQGESLKYGRQGLQKGSLIVMANDATGVGGLPFHVQGSSAESIFDSGMVVVMPLTMQVPFMPSREEVKYTDEMDTLLRAIDAAARKAILRATAALFKERSLSSKVMLTQLLGRSDSWHCYARAVRGQTAVSEELRNTVGGKNWTGMYFLPEVPGVRSGVSLKYLAKGVLQPVTPTCGELGRKMGKSGIQPIGFTEKSPMRLVVNDLSSGGHSRFRAWLDSQIAESVLFIAHKADVSLAKSVAHELAAVYGHELEVVLTSSMPSVTRTVIGSTVIATKVRSCGSLIYHCRSLNKQMPAIGTLDSLEPGETKRIWVGKSGAMLSGYKDTLTVPFMFNDSGFRKVLQAGGVQRLYLLAPKQESDLKAMLSTLEKEGLLDMSEEELLALPDGPMLCDSVAAAKSWMHLEDFAAEMLESAPIQAVMTGAMMQKVVSNIGFSCFIQALARSPRMELTGTRIDKALAPHVDVVSAINKMHYDNADTQELYAVCQSLALLGAEMDFAVTATPDRKELADALVALGTAGFIDYGQVREKLFADFPLLGTLKGAGLLDPEIDALSKAMAALYR